MVTLSGLAPSAPAAIGLLAAPAAAVTLLGCPSQQTVVVKLQGAEADALVTINDRYVGKLAVLQHRGIKLPAGTYRVSVEKVGYFPWDQLVEVDETPLTLDVTLVAIPD